MNEYKQHFIIEHDKLIQTITDYVKDIFQEQYTNDLVKFIPMTFNLHYLGLMIKTNGQPVLDIYLDSDYKWKLPLNKLQYPANHIDNINLWKRIENYNERGVFERE